MNLLFVDDEQRILEELFELATYLGHKVYMASDADEALNILDKNIKLIDIVFTDLKMPGKSGLELVRDIEKKYKNRSFRIFLMSGHLEDDFSDKSLCITGFLKKPLDVKNFQRVLNTLRSDG